MHTDTVPEIRTSRLSTPVPSSMRPATPDRGAASVPAPTRTTHHIKHWVRFASGCGLAELDIDPATGGIERLYYRIDTAPTSAIELERKDPSSCPTSVFLGAALSMTRGMHRHFPGDKAACRSVLELVAALEVRCARSVAELSLASGRDPISVH